MVLDGRGSASLSHIGTAAAISTLRTAIRGWEGELAALLDTPNRELAAIGWQGMAQLLYHVAATEQLKLAAWYETQADNFEFTLTLAVVGRANIGWMSVGDSPLVVLRNGIMGLATTLDEVTFANQTMFVTARPPGRLGLRGGVFPSRGVEALLAMSDGTASRLLHLKQQVPADSTAEIARGLAPGVWTDSLLRDMLKDPGWDCVTRDDRSLAILALRAGMETRTELSGTGYYDNLSVSGPSVQQVVSIKQDRACRVKKTAGTIIGALIASWLVWQVSASVHH